MATEKGLDFLPPRETRAPGTYVNEALKQKELQEKEEAERER